MATKTLLTIADFEQLPQEEAEGHELVDGELVDVSGNNLEHNSLQLWLAAGMLQTVSGQHLGTVLTEQEYDFNGNAHGPDISFFGLEKQSLREPKRRVQPFVPDLAVEIVSPDDTFDALAQKTGRYRKCGTAEVWIVSPVAQEVLVYSERGDCILRGDALLSTPLIPGFRIPVRALFEQI